MSELWRRLLFYLRRVRFDRDLNEGMGFHLETQAEENGRRYEGRRSAVAARRQFGNVTLLK